MNNHNQPISGGSINNNNIYLPSLRYEDMSEWGKQQMDMADKILDELLLSKENNTIVNGGGSLNKNNKFLPPIRYEDMSEWGKQQMDKVDKIFDDWEKEINTPISGGSLLLPPIRDEDIGEYSKEQEKLFNESMKDFNPVPLEIKNGGGKIKQKLKFKKTIKKKK
jgi:hypothetical protein